MMVWSHVLVRLTIYFLSWVSIDQGFKLNKADIFCICRGPDSSSSLPFGNALIEGGRVLPVKMRSTLCGCPYDVRVGEGLICGAVFQTSKAICRMHTCR